MIVYIDETFHVMIARAEEDQMEDMLFTWGDHNDQGFLAWKRIKYYESFDSTDPASFQRTYYTMSNKYLF